MRKDKKPCIFCRGLRIRKFDWILILIVCLVMYWVNQYQLHQIQEEQVTQQTSQKSSN